MLFEGVGYLRVRGVPLFTLAGARPARPPFCAGHALESASAGRSMRAFGGLWRSYYGDLRVPPGGTVWCDPNIVEFRYGICWKLCCLVRPGLCGGAIAIYEGHGHMK